MNRNLHGAIVRCNWIGLYEWSKGWVSKELHDKFREYWSGKKPKYYGYTAVVPGQDSASAICIYSEAYREEHVSVYLHPQGFNTWVTAEKKEVLDAAITHLEIMCNEVADVCGVKCTFNAYYPSVNQVIIVNDKLV